MLQPVPDIEIFRRRDQLEPVDDRRLRRAVRSGTWMRLVAGCYVRTDAWTSLTAMQQHRLRLRETLHRVAPDAVVSHRSAAASHDIDILGHWPTTVDLTVERASGGRSSGGIRRHALGLDAELTSFGDHFITTSAQTAVDLARVLPLPAAVSAVDQAIWTGRPGGPLTTVDRIDDLLTAQGGRRGDVHARRVLSLADPGSSNVRESQNHVVVVSLGFPRPIVQYHRVLRSGRLAIADLYFPDDDHWCEIDGRGKYLSPKFGSDRSPAQIVIDEKNRENEIRREVRGFSRLEAADADNPRVIWDILTAGGLRSSRPRP